jgi:hypothetical protein
MHATDDGVYHVQLRGTIRTYPYIHYSKKCFARLARSGTKGSVRVIDGDLFTFTVFIQILYILCVFTTCLSLFSA